MAMSDIKLCYGCMQPLGTASVCPHCGYDQNATSLADYLKPGTMLHERFLVGKMLSANGEGVTYVGYDTSVDCKILIREYFPERLCSRVPNSTLINVNYEHLAQYKALMAEYTEMNKALARLRNLSHLNPALDMFSENNTTYAVYEFLEGHTLLDYLKENAGELSWSIVRRIFPPLFTTLSLLHNAGVLHRGLSPETIFVTEKGEIKLTGFCISAVRTNDTELDAELFDGYAAPEQYFADRQQGTWTDVYGICAVLYRILTGCRASDAISRQDYDNLVPPNELNPKIPENVSDGIMKGLLLDGAARVRNITDLVTLLFDTETLPEPDASRTSEFTNIPPSKESTAVFHPHNTAEHQKLAEHQSAPHHPQRRPAPQGSRPAGPQNRGQRPPQNGQRRPPQNGQRRPPQHGTAADAVAHAGHAQNRPNGNGNPQHRRQPAAAISRHKEDEATVFERIRAPLFIAFLFILIVTVVIWAFIRIWSASAGSNTLFHDKTSSVNDSVIPAQTDETEPEVHPDANIPNLINMSYTVKREEMAGWLELEPEFEFSDVYVKDLIFWQEFEEGTEFVTGSTMKVKVSLGSSIVTIPNFKGLRLPSYLKKLEEMGLVAAIDGGGNNNMAPGAAALQNNFSWNFGGYATMPPTTTAPPQTVTTTKNGKMQVVKYVATVDYNYQNSYVCNVTPEPGKVINALEDYEIIVYYAYNPVVVTATWGTQTGTMTTGTGGTKNTKVTGTGTTTKTTTKAVTDETPKKTEEPKKTEPPQTERTEPPKQITEAPTQPPPPPSTDPPTPQQTDPPAPPPENPPEQQQQQQQQQQPPPDEPTE